MMEPSILVDFEWSTSTEGKRHINASKCFHSNSNASCGLLEQPSALLPQIGSGKSTPKVQKHKVLVCSPIGKVGKTSLIAKLCGNAPPKRDLETAGLVGHLRYWPVKIKSSGEVVYFQLMFLEYGLSAEKNYPSVVKLALDGCEALIIAFSLTNKNSFDMLPNTIQTMKDKFQNYSMADMPPEIVVVGTHADAVQQIEVSQQDLTEFRRDFYPVFRFKCSNSTANVPSIALPTTEDESKRLTLDSETISFMNNFCNFLLLRDTSLQ
ncbi:ciliogenesis and planar polarity effector 2-like [Convolutriloba macropyga]|uniref:ciliogenesis and planar polarity effector 2-like n=1 Tax=Convolutriloba macropyga TaxID=536237 RepID=UPI003F5285E2